MKQIINTRDKKIYYLAGLPRTGNTLLGSILNQNPKIKVSPNSILVELIWRLHSIKENKLFLNVPDHQTVDNVIKRTFKHYYDSTDADIIFDRGPWGIPTNLELLKKYCDPNPKFLILNRPLVEVLASFLKVKKSGTDKDLTDTLMDPKTGKLKQDIVSSRNIVKSDLPYLKIEYNNLVSDTKKTIEDIYKFFNIPTFEHRYTNLEQLSYNNVKYDDSVMEWNLHTIRTDEVKKEELNLEDYFSKDTIDKMKGYNIYD